MLFYYVHLYQVDAGDSMKIAFADAVCGLAVGAFPRSASAMKREAIREVAANLVAFGRNKSVCVLDDLIGKIVPALTDLLCANPKVTLQSVTDPEELERLDDYIAHVVLQVANRRTGAGQLTTTDARLAFIEEMRVGFKPAPSRDLTEIVVETLIAATTETGRDAVPARWLANRIPSVPYRRIVRELNDLLRLGMVWKYGNTASSAWCVC